MTPSRGSTAGGAAASSTQLVSSTRTCRWLVVLLSLLLGAAQGFLFGPAAGGFGELRRGSQDLSRQYCRMGRIATSQPTVREPAPQSVCRMVSGSGGDVGAGAEGGEGNEELGSSSSQPPPEEQQVEEGQADGDAGVPQDVEGLVSPTIEGEEAEAEDMPQLLNPTREELERAFPNPPKAPYPTLPDPRKFTAEQLATGANLPVSYGGQPAARRANIDFERSERERIHFETATRVMNYQIQADRQKLASGANAGEVKKMERPDIMEELSRYEEDEFKGVEAIYSWDQTPKLITFSGYGVLYNYHLSVGILMREALGRAHDYVHRLPGPSFFQKNYQIAHAEASFQIPCFGARENITSWDWWFHVFTEAYLNTINDFFMDEDIVLEKIDDIVDELYYEVMVGPEAFEPVPQMKIVLDRLAAWRDRDGGPKLAVLGNDDERLHFVLENLGLLPYFDFVMTSRETGYEAGDPRMFETALKTAGVEIPRKGLHIGCDYATDISGSCEAGMEACCVKPMQPEYEAPGEPYEYHRITEVGELLNRLGLPEADQEYLVRRRGKFWEENDDDEDYEDEFGYGDEVVQAL